MYNNLTIKKQAPSMTAFILTSKSIGKFIPKLSASVKASRAKPLHLFEIFPTSVPPSRDKTLNSTSPQSEKVHIGPSILRTTSPSAFLMTNVGVNMLHCCSTVPANCPGGENTSRD